MPLLVYTATISRDKLSLVTLSKHAYMHIETYKAMGLVRIAECNFLILGTNVS